MGIVTRVKTDLIVSVFSLFNLTSSRQAFKPSLHTVHDFQTLNKTNITGLQCSGYFTFTIEIRPSMRKGYKKNLLHCFPLVQWMVLLEPSIRPIALKFKYGNRMITKHFLSMIRRFKLLICYTMYN